jgi:oligosaccharide repeat unit polymerase
MSIPEHNPSVPGVQLHPRRDYGIQSLLERSQLLFVTTTVMADVIIAGLGFATEDAGLIYCSVAILMFMIPAVIGLARRPKFDIFEPINIVAFSILFGTTMRAFYVLLAHERPRAHFLMMRQSFSEVNAHVLPVLLGVVLFCCGYLLRFPRFKMERMRIFRNYELGKYRFRLVTIVSMLITLVGILAFFVDFKVHFTLGLLTESQKRFTTYTTASGETVYGAGWETVISQATQFPFIIYAAAMLAKKIRVTPYSIGFAFFLFFVGSIVPYLASNRSSIIIILFSICVLAYYYRRLRLRSAMIAFATVIFVVASMGSIRAAGRVSEGQDALDWTVGSGNGFDTIRTAAVIGRVPSEHDYIRGASYEAIPFFWVPRAIWPDKPQVGLGAWTKRELFHEKWVTNAGWPPTVVGEAWINFGMAGVIIVLPLVGILFRQFYESCRPLLGRSLPITALYSVTVYRLGFNCFELDLSAGFVSILTTSTSLLLFLWLSKGRTRGRLHPVAVRTASAEI